MSVKRMDQLAELGQSVWLDYISRPLLETGKLKALIDEGLRGMTSNPSIFNQAIGSSSDYDEKIVELKASGKTSLKRRRPKRTGITRSCSPCTTSNGAPMRPIFLPVCIKSLTDLTDM